MQIIIDIPEEQYNIIKSDLYNTFPAEMKKWGLEAIRNGTPQPKKGRWIKQNYGWNWQCSECGFVTPPSAKEIFTFCPKCGAKMEVEE